MQALSQKKRNAYAIRALAKFENTMMKDISRIIVEFTDEYVVAEFSDRSDPRVVMAARIRLEQHGVKLPKD